MFLSTYDKQLGAAVRHTAIVIAMNVCNPSAFAQSADTAAAAKQSVNETTGGDLSAGNKSLAVVKSPFHSTGLSQAGAGIDVRILSERREELQSCTGVHLEGFALSPEREVALELSRFSIVLPNAIEVINEDEMAFGVPAADIALFKGHVVGEAESWAYLAVTDERSYGIVHIRSGEEYLLVPVPQRIANGDAANHLVYERHSAFAGAPPGEPFCHVKSEHSPAPINLPELPEGALPQRILWLAIDSDWEYRNLFTSVNEAISYTIALLGAIHVIYERDLNVNLYLSYLRIWDTPNDPWTAGNTDLALNELIAWWEFTMTGVCRDVAHFCSGKPLGGGLAWQNQMCTVLAYGVSGEMTGNQPLPPPLSGPSNWDLIVVAHEVGHNLGADHTHCYDPPVDTCAGQGFDCPHPQACQQGTLMSYCHLCAGGESNIDLVFHPTSIADIQLDVALSCLRYANDPTYVSFAGVPCQETGTVLLPYRTVGAGVMGVLPAGDVLIVPGNYDEAVTVFRPLTLKRLGSSGVATIGQ